MILALFVSAFAATSGADGNNEKRKGKRSYTPILAQCIDVPTPYVNVGDREVAPAYKVTLKQGNGQLWVAYVDHQWSEFEWRPFTFLYADAYRKELNQQTLKDIADRCGEISGGYCLTVDVSMIDANPRFR
jgi:hypothetical protein